MHNPIIAAILNSMTDKSDQNSSEILQIIFLALFVLFEELVIKFDVILTVHRR